MPRLGTYHLARIVKQNLKPDDIIEALHNPEIITVGEFQWTISDFIEIPSNNGNTIYFGNLTKYVGEGPIASLDEETHTTVNRITQDMIVASSPFVYIPEYSGIGFLHVWNKIETETFRKRFAELILTKFQHFFVECQLENITDLNTFILKLNNMDYVNRVYAKVKPPNPSFGWLWKDLNAYMKKRKTEELTIEEKGHTELASRLKEYISSINQKQNISETNVEKVDIGDAAILMAADGYGIGKVEGKSNGSNLVISTSDNSIVIKLNRNPEPQELYDEVIQKFKKISKERHMGH